MPVTTGESREIAIGDVQGLPDWLYGIAEDNGYVVLPHRVHRTGHPTVHFNTVGDDPCPITYEQYREALHSRADTSEDEFMQIPEQVEALPAVLPNLQPCSYLSVGQTFQGFQRFSSTSSRIGGHASTSAAEDWQVTLRIQGCDMSRGYVCGVMEAHNVPQAKTAVMTFWEGEIVDNINNTFFTKKWGASRDEDLSHWGKFPGFADMRTQVVQYNGRCGRLPTSHCIFLRLKEQFFVNVGSDCGLTIAGFYYVCLNRQLGCITGYYYDPNSPPFQFLELRPQQSKGLAGIGFGSYALR